MFNGHTSRWQVVPEINKGLVRLAADRGVKYIDLYPISLLTIPQAR